MLCCWDETAADDVPESLSGVRLSWETEISRPTLHWPLITTVLSPLYYDEQDNVWHVFKLHSVVTPLTSRVSKSFIILWSLDKSTQIQVNVLRLTNYYLSKFPQLHKQNIFIIFFLCLSDETWWDVSYTWHWRVSYACMTCAAATAGRVWRKQQLTADSLEWEIRSFWTLSSPLAPGYSVEGSLWKGGDQAVVTVYNSVELQLQHNQ